MSKDHFNADAIEAKQQGLLDRYQKLAEPVAIRKKLLEDSKDYQQFLHDVEDEESWIREKEPIVSSLHTGMSLKHYFNNFQRKLRQFVMDFCMKHCCI